MKGSWAFIVLAGDYDIWVCSGKTQGFIIDRSSSVQGRGVGAIFFTKEL